MWIESELDYLRTMVKASLPSGASLKLDRGDGLFITNAPLISSEPVYISGFNMTHRGKMLVLLPEISLCKHIESGFPAPVGELSAALLRFHGKEPDSDVMPLIVRGLKLSFRKDMDLCRIYDRDVRQYAACAMRKGNTGGIYAAALLADTLLDPNMEDTL